MLDLIKDISTAKGIHIVLSSHLLPDIEYACQDVVFIHQGRFIMQDSIKRLRNAHHALFEVKIKGDQDVFTSALQELNLKCRPMENDILRIELPDMAGTEVFFRLAAENDLQIRHLTSTRYSLEDIYAQAVGEGQ